MILISEDDESSTTPLESFFVETKPNNGIITIIIVIVIISLTIKECMATALCQAGRSQVRPQKVGKRSFVLSSLASSLSASAFSISS